MPLTKGFYITPTSYYYSGVYRSIPTYEEDIGVDSDIQNSYAKGMIRNNPFYMAVARNYRKGVISTGFNIQSKTGVKYKVKGKKKKVNFDKKFEKIIKQWSKRGNCELTGRYFFQEAQRMMVSEYVTVGGFIVRHHSNNNFKFGYKFELISLSLIDTSKHNVSRRIFNGFQLNQKGEVIGVWIFTDYTKHTSVLISSKKLTISINKLFDINQYSGVSPLVSVFEAMEYIDNYKATQMKGANKRANNPILIHSPITDILMMKSAKEYAEEKRKKGEIVSNEPSYEMINRVWQMQRLDNKKIDSDFAYLRHDETVTETGKAVENIYDFMYRNESRSASAGVGLSASSTVGEMPSSYNATLKAGMDEEAEYKIVAQEIASVLEHIVEYHLLNAVVAKNIISPSDYWVKPDKYRNLVFLRIERGHIDPVKTAKALTEDIYINKTKTMQRALGEKGIDYEDYLKEKKEWEEKTLKMEIEIEEKRLKAFSEIQKKYKKIGIDYIPPIRNNKNTKSTISDFDLGEHNE